ncbi:hypothetical protein G6011_06963 [Alternaria panax]|uniref:Uncharacterized protein n=1 Tax=Alternaria panax TaxID=48097 RepID=A0AAD4F8U0_9PLEO|nr:hypothetical protein G6011_06963 [Alternaria panax]
MYLSYPILAVGLASSTAGTAFRRAPYSNATLRTTLPVPGSTPAAILPETLLQSVSSFGTGSASEHRILRPTDAASIGPQISSVLQPNATSSDAHNTTLSQAQPPPLATLEIGPSSINDTAIQQPHISNATCTVNIPDAIVDYWFVPTYSHPVGIMTTQASNFSNVESYTLVPYTTTFDAFSALASDFVCSYSMSYYAEWDFTLTMCEEYTRRPNAATTSVAYRSAAYSPFPSGGVIPVSDARLYDLYNPDTFPSATATISLGPNTTTVQTSATPFVYFTAYEVESGDKTETVHLPSPQAYPYWLKGMEEQTTVTGPIPDGFLEQITQSACDAGKLQAVVTVLVIVDLYYQNWPNMGPAFLHIESSVLGFDDLPIVVNNWNTGTSMPPPLTVADWNLPDIDGAPTPTSVKPNSRPDSIPTTRMRGGNNNNNAVNSPEFTRVTVGSVGTKAIVAGPSSEVIVGSQTVRAGGPPVTVGDGTVVSLAPSATAIIVDGRTSRLPQVAQSRPPPVLTIGSTTLTPNAATQFFVGPGQTLSPGGVATIDGTIVSLDPSASFIVVGGSTQALPESLPVPGSPPQFVIGSSTITAQASDSLNNQNNHRPNPTFIVSGQTLAPGAPAITVSGTTLSLASSGSVLVVNGASSTIRSPAVPDSTPPALTVGNSVFSAFDNPRNTFVIAGQTLVPGGSAITAFGTTLLLASSASFLLVDGATSVVLGTDAPTINVGNSVFAPITAPSGRQFIIGDQSLIPGGPAITFSGTALSLAPFASFVIVDGVTSSLVTPSLQFGNSPIITIGDNVINALPEPSGPIFVVDDQTLIPGGSELIVSGTTLSLAQSASYVVVNGVTSMLATPASPLVTAPPLTIGHATFRPLPGTGTAYLIGSILLTTGGSIVVSGMTISLAHGATALAINGKTSFISPQVQSIVTNPPLLTIGSQTYTAEAGSGMTFAIGGQILTPGGTITVDGTTITLAPGATELIYGSSGRTTKSALFPVTTTRLQSATSSADASAGASRPDGQATATSKKEGTASHLVYRSSTLLAVVVISYSCFA